ncbi:MAG: GNAT family N-acetyltransferase [Acidimicrobiales bacterium]
MARQASGPAVTDNVAVRRFELHVDGELRSFATYRDRNGALVVPHVETVRAHRGNGFAERLMDGVVENLRQTDRQIAPVCPFAAQYLRARPETHDLLSR